MEAILISAAALTYLAVAVWVGIVIYEWSLADRKYITRSDKITSTVVSALLGAVWWVLPVIVLVYVVGFALVMPYLARKPAPVNKTKLDITK